MSQSSSARRRNRAKHANALKARAASETLATDASSDLLLTNPGARFMRSPDIARQGGFHLEPPSPKHLGIGRLRRPRTQVVGVADCELTPNHPLYGVPSVRVTLADGTSQIRPISDYRRERTTKRTNQTAANQSAATNHVTHYAALQGAQRNVD